MLPHLKTFPGYKAHVTIAYIAKHRGEAYRDQMIEEFRKLWIGKGMMAKAIIYGGKK